MVIDIVTKPLTLATSPSEIRSNVIWNVNKRGAVESFDFLLDDDRALSATDDDLRTIEKDLLGIPVPQRQPKQLCFLLAKKKWIFCLRHRAQARNRSGESWLVANFTLFLAATLIHSFCSRFCSLVSVIRWSDWLWQLITRLSLIMESALMYLLIIQVASQLKIEHTERKFPLAIITRELFDASTLS